VGIIDTLSAGFDLVRRRPWMLALPVAVDIGLWVAPKLSVFTLLQNLWHALLSEATATGAATPAMIQSMQEALPEMVQMARDLDLSLLLPLTSVGVPILPVGPSTSFFGLTKQVIELAGGLPLLALALALALGGLLIGTFYMALIAQAVRDGRVDWPLLVQRVPRYWLRLIGVGLVVGMGLLAFGLPVAMVIGIFGLVSPGLASFLLAIPSFLVFWVMIYMVFVPEAIIFSEDGIMKAIWRSAIIVRTNFWPAIGLILLSYIISTGLAFVWGMLAATAPGALVAAAGSAFIGTGLTAALFIFYRERLRAPLWTGEPQRS
jgi:hypothetical protein